MNPSLVVSCKSAPWSAIVEPSPLSLPTGTDILCRRPAPHSVRPRDASGMGWLHTHEEGGEGVKRGMALARTKGSMHVAPSRSACNLDNDDKCQKFVDAKDAIDALKEGPAANMHPIRRRIILISGQWGSLKMLQAASHRQSRPCVHYRSLQGRILENVI